MDTNLAHAIDKINSGNLLAAQSILVNYLKDNPKDEKGWSCLYSCVFSRDQKQFCLERVLKIDSENEHAISELRMIYKGQENYTDFPIISSTYKRITENENPLLILDEKKLTKNKAKVPDKSNQEKKEIIKAKVIITDKKVSDVKKANTTKIKKRIKSSERKAKPEVAGNSSINKIFDPKEFSDITVTLRPPKVIIKVSTENYFEKTRIDLSDFPNTESGMFGNRLIIGGLSITPHDFPKCIEVGHTLPKSQCYICDFFSAADCPMRYDPDIIRTVTEMYSQTRRYWKRNKDNRDAVIDAIYEELKAHGRPLHYETVYRMIVGRHPQLRLTPLKIARLMSRHSEKFEWVDRGVYRAK